MPNPIHSSEYPSFPADDEINLADLVRSIWDGRWLIAGITAIVTTLGAGYAWIAPDKLETTLAIQAPTQTEIGAYEPLNALEKFAAEAELLRQRLLNPPENDATPLKMNHKAGLDFTITADGLRSKVLEQLDTRTHLLEAITASGLVKATDYAETQDYKTALESVAYDFEILPPEAETKKNQQRRENWAVRYSGPQNTKLVLETLDYALSAATESARTALIQEYKTKKAIYLQNRDHRLEDLKTKLANAFDDYEKKTQQQLASLKENAEIARSLGLKSSTIETQNYQGFATIVTNTESASPLYLRGYIALEKEIEQISARTNKADFIAERIELEAEIRRLEQDRTAERYDHAFAQTPLLNPNAFRAVHYSLTNAETKNGKKTPLILALSVVLGGMLGLMTLFFKNALSSNTRSESQPSSEP